MCTNSVMCIALSDSATVQDLIGLAFWKYNEGRKEPIKFVSLIIYSNLWVYVLMWMPSQKPITRYTVRIAEDDGEIDTDLPGMYISKFWWDKL